jgi:hypothetical protein
MTKRLPVIAFLACFFGVSAAFCQDKMMPGEFGPDAGRAMKANTDVLGEEVLASGEPSFSRIENYFPAMKRPRAIVGVKGHPDFIGVAWDGTLELGKGPPGTFGRVQISFHLGDPPSACSADGAVTRSLLGGYLPVVQTRWQFNGLLYEETVLGHSRNLSPDEPLWAYVKLRVTNPREQESSARITIYSTPALGGPVPSFSARIPAHQQHDFYFSTSNTVDPQHLVFSIGAAEFDQALNETAAFWNKLLNQDMVIRTPETRVNDAYRAWLMYNFLNVPKIKGQYMIYDGRPFYEQVYGYSAALYCDALSQYGYGKDSEKYLESLFSTQQPDGEYLTIYGTPDNGAMLFALAQHYVLSHDLGWFKTVAPKMIKSCEWISRSRAMTRVMQGGSKPLTYGLLPAGPAYCDYQIPVYSYVSDSYNWLGMHEAALAFQEAGMVANGQEWLRQANDYRDDILTSMQAALVDVGGFKALPVEPLTQRLLKQGGGDYYGLIAPGILETGIFGQNNVRGSWITRYMDERGGLLLGLDRYADGVDHAYTYGYALTQLRNGNIGKFLLTFYAMLAYGMSRGTYSAVEVTHLPLGINELTLPHTYSNTQQLRMLRMMLVREEGDDLLLASGTPRAWLEAGDTISVQRAPTPYGLLSYNLAADTAGNQFRATIEPLSAGTGSYPEHIKLWMRTPRADEKPKDFTLNGKPCTSFHDDVIDLPGTMMREKLEFVARY